MWQKKPDSSGLWWFCPPDGKLILITVDAPEASCCWIGYPKHQGDDTYLNGLWQKAIVPELPKMD